MMFQTDKSVRFSAAVAISLFVIAAALLRFYQIGFSSYWLDEMVSVYFSSHGTHFIFRDNAPFLYHLLLAGWMALFGNSEVATRGLSALFSIMTMIVLSTWAWRNYRWRGLLIVAPLYGLSRVSILFAQETRMYSMLEFATALNMTALLSAIKKEKASWLFAGSSVLMILTHYLALIPLGLSALIIFRKTKNSKTRAAIALTSIAVILIAVLSYLKFFSWEHLEWQKLRYQVDPNSWWPRDALWVFVNESVLTAIVLGALAVWGIRRIRDSSREEFLTLFTLVTLPFALMMIASLVTKRWIMNDRYLLFVYPYWIACTTVLLVHLWERKKTAALLALTLISADSVRTLPSVYRQVKAPWREMAQLVGAQPKSIVLTTRTLAIMTPYFDRQNISVVSWNPVDPKMGEEEIRAYLRQGFHVWILDNYWGAFTYMAGIQARLSQATDLKISPVSTKTAHSEPIFALHVELK